MTHEKVIKMIDEYILQDNINEEWVEALKVCRQSLLDVEIQKAEIGILIRKKNILKDEIAEQQAEIERLNKEVDRLSQCVMYHEGQIIDAIKEFAERLKEKGTPVTSGKGFEGVYVMCSNLVIDNTLKEIIGDNNG